MGIDRKINHYSLNNPASIYNEEALTSLELSARTAGLVNECVDEFNKLEENTVNHLTDQDEFIEKMNNDTMPAKVKTEVQEHIDNGDFDSAINKYAGNLNERVNNLLNNVPEGGTTMDAEIVDVRVDGEGVEHNDAGTAVRNQIKNAKDVSAPLTTNNLLNNALSVKEGYFYNGDGEVSHNEYVYFTLKLKAGTYYSDVMPRYIVDITNNTVLGDADNEAPQVFEIKANAVIHITFKQVETPKLYDFKNTPYHEVEKLGEKKLSSSVELPATKMFANDMFISNNLFNKAEVFEGYLDITLNVPSQVTPNYKLYKVWLEGGSYTVSPRVRFISNMESKTQIGDRNTQASDTALTFEVPEASYYYISMYNGESHKLYDASLSDSEVDLLGSIRLSSRVQPNDTEYNGNVLYKKKYVACGDSFTEGGANENITEGKYAGYKQAYPYFIGNRNNMEVINLAVNGMTMCNIDGTRANAFSNEVYKNIPLDADYITLKFGINDHNFSSPLGSIGDTDTTTFYGAWNTVMEYIITNIPFAKVGIIVTNGTARTELTEATRAIARRWGVPVLDEAGNYNVPLLNRVHEKSEVCAEAINARTNAFRVSETDGHPNGKAHAYESTFIEAFMRTL